MLKKLSLLTLVALMGIVASGTMAYALSIKITSPVRNQDVYGGYIYVEFDLDDYDGGPNQGTGKVTIHAVGGGEMIAESIGGLLTILDSTRNKVMLELPDNWTDRTQVFMVASISTSRQGKASSQTVKFYATGIVVWPGDTDNSGKVDASDVGPIGNYWKKTGPARPNASSTWTGQKVPAGWSPREATYADANGDGIVDAKDVLIVGLNWGRTH